MAIKSGAPTPTVPAGRGSRCVSIALAIGVALTAFIWLNRLNPTFQLTDDGIRDQLLMRDCTELGRCHRIGAATSLAGFHQGAVWLDLLIAVRLLGGDTSTQKTVVLALLALSVATLFVVVWRWVRPSLALPAAVLFTAALSLDSYPSQLINPSASAFPDVLTAAGLLCYGLSGQRRFLMLAAFALGLGINMHVGSLSLVPSLVIIAMLARERPWGALIACLGVLAVTYVVTSGAALLANLIGLARDGRLIPLLAGGVALIVASAGMRSRFQRCSADARAWSVAFILIVPFGLASMWLVLWQKHHFGITYLHPILGPMAAFAGALVAVPFEIGARWRRALRWIPSVAALGGLMFVALPIEGTALRPASSEKPSVSSPTADLQPWTLDQATAIAAQAVKDGWNYENLVFHLQSNACRELLAAMSLNAPAPDPALKRGRRMFQVVRTFRDEAGNFGETAHVVPLGHRGFAIVRDVESWLQPEALKACRRGMGSDQSPRCSAANHIADAMLTPDHFLFLSRSYPEIHALDLPPPYVASYEIPLSPGTGETRDLLVMNRSAPGCADWHITRVEAVEFEDALPATHVRLRSSSGHPGVVTIEKPFLPTCVSQIMDDRYPPCVFETWPGDPLRSLVERG